MWRGVAVRSMLVAFSPANFTYTFFFYPRLVPGFSENREARMIQVHEVEGFYPEAENKLFELASEMRLN